MSPRARRTRLFGWGFALILIGSLLGLAGTKPTTAALVAASGGYTTLRASAAGPPGVIPDEIRLGVLPSGVVCEMTPILDVLNTSDWALAVSVEASGWLLSENLTVSPGVIAPGGTATVFFSKAVVELTGSITGQVRVGAATAVSLSGSVVALSPLDPLPPGCRLEVGESEDADMEPGDAGGLETPESDHTEEEAP